MYRKLEDDFSPIQLKIGDTIPWTYGYKVFDSKGDFEPNIEDWGVGTLMILEGASTLVTASAMALTALSVLTNF